MEQFIKDKIASLALERERLAELEGSAENIVIAGLAQQEITRNEGLLEIYRGILAHQSWASA